MGIFSALLGRNNDYESEDEYTDENETFAFPALFTGMSLTVETPEGEAILTGRITEFSADKGTLSLDRLPGGLSFGIREVGSSVTVRGLREDLTPFFLRGTIQESTRLVCRLKDLKVKPIPEQRDNFRLLVSIPATMYYQADGKLSHPEECTLVDISTGGACIESEYLHAVDEVLRLKVKLFDYAPMEFLGEVIRVTELSSGKFRYGFLFAQLKESELRDLTRTLYNIQVGNHDPKTRSTMGHW